LYHELTSGLQALAYRNGTCQATFGYGKVLPSWKPYTLDSDQASGIVRVYTTSLGFAQARKPTSDSELGHDRILTECRIRHPHCPKFHSVEEPLPTRVLLIQEEDGRMIIRLIDGPQQIGPYVALSYVWGDSGQFSLTTETEQSLRTGIDVAELAKTTREAAELTHALGLEYLWIDALCIKQDSVSVWEEQSSQMTQVYSNSELTLIAARSSGVETGSFRPAAACVAYCGSVQYQGTWIFPHQR
jgi:hypothetical protein